ncbi:hypothetical protein Bhyg_12121, partial [Pseudolycoriella hygida]
WMLTEPSNMELPLITMSVEQLSNAEQLMNTNEQFNTKPAAEDLIISNTCATESGEMSFIDDLVQISEMDMLKPKDDGLGKRDENELTRAFNETNFDSFSNFLTTVDDSGAWEIIDPEIISTPDVALLQKNVNRDSMTTLDNVVELISNQKSDDLASNVTYVLKP